MATVATLPEAVRDDLKEPLGPVYGDAAALLEAAGRPLVAVGDVVTYHLLEAGVTPAVAVVDGRTEREAVGGAVADRLAALTATRQVANPAGTLSAGLVEALVAAIGAADAGDRVIEVDGEEDLAALPAVIAAPEGATVVYGQPGEGMVGVHVDAGTRERATALLERFDTDERLWDLLDDAP
ncbi:MAG: GTP-dependent dephospho-CoA kinase family protein [Halobacteriaceae archaeon]